ncbi:neuropathy target esterase sws isoform X2 [Tribolium castaneum]|uniref:neuropathy target esterase sws isoform X2 n=1 Tax=Tribolium castaneum TaxID=7070 RepID=UPI00046C1A14|nr:PREDICTED: neuropathy target esterase sws isoform X2 [Tribolium castaneum]|eukprot:XP_015840327.1 PREDICTED: neuropathy target esterase sws isoform X2 [Tribolium castaneum]
MDVLNAVYNLNNEETLKSSWFGEVFSSFSTQETYQWGFQLLPVLLAAIFATIISVTYFCIRKCHRKALFARQLKSEEASARFRKRDKALFYGRKMLRKVKNISGQVRNSGQGRKRKMVMKFARRILQLKKENDTEQLKVLEPPVEYLQEEMLSDDRMPPDALYMLQSIRVFGHFEKPIFLKLCKHTEVINVDAGQHLFKIGDADENVYIVQSGKLNVFIASADNTNLSLKIVKPGESVTSLLSFTDVLTGNTNPYKTVSAKAIEDSTVVKLPMVAFQEIFHEYPDIFIRVIQVIMVRLQRVTFTALHQYLGLSAELVKQGPKSRNSKNPLVGGSPMKKKREDFRDGSFSSMDASQPIPVPGHRRSKSSLESKSFSPQTPDMVSDAEMATSGMTPDVALLQRKRHSVDNVDEDTLIEIATEAFIKELNLEDDTMLKGNVQIKEIAAGTYLMQEDSNKDVALCYVISGALIVSQKMTESEDEVHMFTSYHGEFVGGLAVLTGEPSFFTIRAKHFTRIALLSKNTFYSMMKDHPNIVLYVAHSVVQRLSPFVRQVDFALDWLFMESGRAVYRQDDESDSTYIVLSGRLRSVITHKNGKKELVGEYGKGDLIGVVEMVTHTKRSTTVIAVRDSELAKLPEGLFNAIKLKYPIVVTRLINLLGHRILGSWKKPTISVHAPSSSAIDSRPSQLNFSTVAIVAASDDVPLTAFTYELYHCLCAIGPTLRLTSDIIRKILGPTIMDPNNEYRLTSWLAQQEDQHKISLYQCDLTVSAWTQRCIRQADCILIVGLGENHPSIGKVEKEVERLAMRTQKELVLLHREGGKPHNTVAWINMRSWVAWHHHILSPNRMFSRKSLYRINELYSKVCQSEPNIHSDFSRLARWLTGKSVGLVLGGGGARGSAHVGMIKAIQEAGIPIDMVGGVSIGAFMGALWCRERNITTTTQKAREWSKKMTQWWRQILDLTYPMTSMFSGRDFNQTIKGTFGDTYIEDLWLPYFTVTTDITASCMRLHSHGSLWRYVRASMSLSGYMPPLCDPVDGHLLLDGGYTNNLPGHLWRYVRASMSIVGIFPPLCDPLDGHLLADGCYVNNVPADVMRSLGANHIIAIDVGSVDDQDLTNYGDDLSGWWLLWKRWNPFTDPVKVPNLPDIQSRLAYVSCVRQLEEVKNSDYCEYVRPPIDKYKTLQFGSFDEIREVGYQHGKAYFEEKSKSGNLPIFKAPTVTNKPETEHILSDYTFTDLAQMVCKVSRPYEESSSSSSSGDEFEDGQDGYASEPTVCLMDLQRQLSWHGYSSTANF